MCLLNSSLQRTGTDWRVARSLLAVVELVAGVRPLTPCASSQLSCIGITSFRPDITSIQQHGWGQNCPSNSRSNSSRAEHASSRHRLLPQGLH